MHVNVRIEPRWTLHRGAARRARALARDRAARAGARDLEVVEGGAPRRVPRLQPERQGPHDLLGVLGAPAARRARVDAARLGRGARLRAGRLHGAHRAAALRRDRRSARRDGRAPRARSRRCSSSRRATRRPGSATRPGRRTSARWRARRRASRRRARKGAERDEAAAREDAAAHRRELARARRRRSPASSAGRRGTPRSRRSSPSTTCWSTRCAAARRTWTRIRVNLRNVPEAHAPAAGDARPRRRSDARVARAAARQAASRSARRTALSAPAAKIAASSCGGDDLELRVGAVARRLVGAPAAELRGVAEARALHVVVGDLDHELGAQRLPREVLALAPAALRARHALRRRLRSPRRPTPSTG